MEKLALISAKPTLSPTSSSNSKVIIPKKQCFGLPLPHKNPNGSLFISKPRSKTILFAFTNRNSRRYSSHNRHNNNNNINSNNINDNVELFESSSTTAQEISSVGVDPQAYFSPPSSQFGSPLFWIGVGVGFSALFSFGASWLKKYAMQKAFKTMMGQMGSQNNQFSNGAIPSGSPFGFPPPSTSGPSTFPSFPYQPPAASGPRASISTADCAYSPPSTSGQSILNAASSSDAKSQTTTPSASVTMDISANKPEVVEPVANDDLETKTEGKHSAFSDISSEETLQPTPFENYDDASAWSSSDAPKYTEVVQNGSVSKEGTSSEWSQETRKRGSLLSVDTLETMTEDPNIQKMIYPHLPKDMRNPGAFKWMLQNPVYRQQLQEMLDNMGEGALDSGMIERLKGFDLNSPEVKQQFDQIGLTPEEAMSRIISQPEIARAFQNPKIQQAIMDCSQNPMNMIKYRDDKEVMDVFNKLQELFPGSSGF